MFRKIIAMSAVIMVALGFSQVSMAAQESAEIATIVVYRADESFKTERLGLDVHIGESSMGRLKSEQAVVITRPAGEYALGTSMKGTDELILDLKPGQTYYVHTEMQLRGTRVQVEMVEVEEQVAKVQQPSVTGAI
jgi:hypothetical protein